MRTQRIETSNAKKVETKVRDLAFQVQFHLQMRQGNNLVKAIGFPHAETNDKAVQCWVRRNYIDYNELDQVEQVKQMATDLFKRFPHQ